MHEIPIEQSQGIIPNMLCKPQRDAFDAEGTVLSTEDIVAAGTAPVAVPTDYGEIIELSGEFDYEGYQVVRREFFAHTNEPSITFNNFKMYVNSACLSRFPSVSFVQVLVNSNTKILAIRPCREEERDAFSWCAPGSARRKPRQITCRLFFAKVFSMMDWNSDYRYKLLGKVIHANGEYLIAFDLSSTEVYQRIFTEGEKPKTSRTPVFPEGWQTQFGLPFREHRNSMQINIFEGYAVYGIRENLTSQTAEGASMVFEPQLGKAENNDISGGAYQ